MLDVKYIQSKFDTEIIPSLVKFVQLNHIKVEQNVIQGEFFTLIRRHLPEITKEKASYSISLINIDLIGVNRDGKIVSIGFSTGSYNRYKQLEETVDTLNEVLKKSVFENISMLSFNLDRIINSVHYAQL